jgi:hypothetical protein
MDCLAKEAFPDGGEKTALEMEGGGGGDGAKQGEESFSRTLRLSDF